MNCFFIAISREWRQNVQIASPYVCVACEIQDIKQELQDWGDRSFEHNLSSSETQTSRPDSATGWALHWYHRG